MIVYVTRELLYVTMQAFYQRLAIQEKKTGSFCTGVIAQNSNMHHFIPEPSELLS